VVTGRSLDLVVSPGSSAAWSWPSYDRAQASQNVTVEYERWTLKGQPCPVCGDDLWYDERHDSEFCARCDDWRIKSCGDPDCSYCRDRPARPSEVTGWKIREE
jgi:hypothetical protein